MSTFAHLKQSLESAKKRFLLFSILGGVAITLCSVGLFEYSRRSMERQEVNFELYELMGSQLVLVNQIALLSEVMDDTFGGHRASVRSDLNIKLDELKKKHSDVRSKLDGYVREDSKFSKFVQGFDERMLDFIDRAGQLIHKSQTSRFLGSDIVYLTISARKGLGTSLDRAIDDLLFQQRRNMHQMNWTLFLFVVSAFLTLMIIWLAVFRPLYSLSSSLHEQLMDEVVRSEAASRAKTEFLANISHEIRTPMTAIVGYADLLTKDGIKGVESSDALRSILHNAQHLLDLITEILDVSKMEAGKFTITPQNVHLPSMLNGIYSLINVKAAEKGIDLVFENSGRVPNQIIADPKRLSQMLYNLIGNAIKFTEKGYVKLTVSCEFDEVEGGEAVVRFRVKDTGLGIPKSQQGRLFRPFEQVDSSSNRRQGGTGLGLVLTKNLAELMDGGIRLVHSEQGKGSEFEIYVRVEVPENVDVVNVVSTNISPVEEKESVNQTALSGRRVMVVDDAKENVRLFSIYLASAGAKVIAKTSAKEAVDHLLEHSKDVDLVLMDLQMPELDGFGALSILQDKGVDVPVLALTAHAMEEDRRRTAEAGFADHLVKPLTLDQLIDSVVSHLG